MTIRLALLALPAVVVLGALSQRAAAQAAFFEGFDNVGEAQPGQDGPSGLISSGFVFHNLSSPPGDLSWHDGYLSDAQPFWPSPQAGAGYLAVDGNSTHYFGGRVSNWMILPQIPGQVAGDLLTFYLYDIEGSSTPTMQVRYSPSGGADPGGNVDSVGDFSTLLMDINPIPTGGGWARFEIPLPGAGRIALRYYIEYACNFGCFHAYDGIDTLSVGPPPPPPCNLPPIPNPGQTVIWTSEQSPYELCTDMLIPEGSTVIVEPGVRVDVQAGHTLVVAGTLRAIGTPTDRVVFTHPAVFPPMMRIEGGTLDLGWADIQGQLRPEAGSNLSVRDTEFIGPTGLIFTGLYVGSGFGLFERVTFTDSEFTISNYTLVLRDLTMNNSFARWNRDYLFFENIVGNGRSLDFSGSPQGTLIDTVSVTGAPYGLGLGFGNYFIGPSVSLQGNTETAFMQDAGILPGSELPATGNINNRVFVPAGDHGFIRSIWADAGVPYYISGFYAQRGGSLSIQPGVTVKMAELSGMAGDPSYIEAVGTEEQPIRFEQAVPGERWYPLQNVYRFRHAVLDGAIRGAAWPSHLGWGFLDSSIVRNCSEFGVTGQAIIRKTQILNNGVGAQVSMNEDMLGLTNPNAIEGNGSGVTGASDATFNWWGSPNGPTTPENPGGDGDSVAPGVPFFPFLTERPDFEDAPPIVDLQEHTFLVRPWEKMVLCWDARDDGQIVSHRVLMSVDGDIVQGNLFEPVITLAEGLPGYQRCIEFIAPEPIVRFFGTGNIRVESTDNLGQIGWDDLHIYVERDEPGQLVVTTDPGPEALAGADLGSFCWNEEDISPIGGSVSAYLLLENSNYYINLGGVTTYLTCLALPLRAPYVSTDRARLVLSLFTDDGISQPEYYFGPPFAIRPDARVGDSAPAITLLSPAPGSSFRGDAVVPIAWSATDDQFVRSISIQASIDGGRTWNFIARDIPGTASSHNWRLPPSDGINELLIKVFAVDRRFQDTSAMTSIVVTPGFSSPPCPADFNHDGSATSADITSFLSAWFGDLSGGTLTADFNLDGATSSADITAFLGAWFAALAGGC
ncbi:MAG: choice-of-anchor J domain-containing protein [Phycisphaerales bacterium]|nr:choice-of-anchor J domain-containing protein [Phycisphaerales bacterium]